MFLHGELQGSEHFPVSRAAFDASGDFLQQALARRVFEQSHEGFNLGAELNKFGFEFRFGGGHARKPGQKTEVAQTSYSAGGGRGPEKGTSW